MIETERLILRVWTDADREPYADIMVEPEVGRWLGGPFSRREAHARIERFIDSLAKTGMGRLAVERKSDGRLIGHCGLAPAPDTKPVPEGLEIGWALAPEAWGQGYAVEAARAVLADGFARLDAPEIFAFTGEANLKSQAVMRRLGMTRAAERDFDHPALAPDHPLRRHIVYVAPRPRTAASSGRS
ncbi:MAG: GNAT family N-acetyltransferase [Proteobacteria bacterium]|nr:GNAT family N-acetyltransferase [Pseudomonadota bacterium]